MTTIALYEGKSYYLLKSLDLNGWNVKVVKPVECDKRIFKSYIETVEWGSSFFTFIPGPRQTEEEAVTAILRNIALFQVNQAMDQIRLWIDNGKHLS